MAKRTMLSDDDWCLDCGRLHPCACDDYYENELGEVDDDECEEAWQDDASG
jgi:hypothetical protein